MELEEFSQATESSSLHSRVIICPKGPQDLCTSWTPQSQSTCSTLESQGGCDVSWWLRKRASLCP